MRFSTAANSTTSKTRIRNMRRLSLGNFILGGGSLSSRLGVNRVRQQEGPLLRRPKRRLGKGKRRPR